MFSKKMISDGILDKIFKNRIQVWRHSWDQPGAYPRLDPRSNWNVPVNIQGLWYINGLEGWISTQETETLAARNIAIQIANHLQQQ